LKNDENWTKGYLGKGGFGVPRHALTNKTEKVNPQMGEKVGGLTDDSGTSRLGGTAEKLLMCSEKWWERGTTLKQQLNRSVPKDGL